MKADKTNVQLHNVGFYKPKPEAACCMALCHDSKKLALSRLDASLEIWNIKYSPFIERNIPSDIENYSIESLSWLRNRLFSVGLHGFIVEYDLFRLTHRMLAAVTGGAAFSLDIYENNKQLAVGTEQGYINIFNIEEDGVVFDKFLDKQDGRILCIKYDVTGKHLVTGGLDAIRIWQIDSGHVMHRLTTGRSHTNKATIVWCLAVTNDFTVISGDSRGKLTFWDAKIGAQIESFKTHQADIVCLCLSEDQNSLFCSGVDPNIINYVKIKVKENIEKWVKNKTRKIHNHDVRALILHGNKLYSSGVDGYLGCSFVEPKTTVIRYPPILSSQCVTISCTARLIMLRYQNYIEVWKLGKSNQIESSNDTGTLKEQPKKLVVLERLKVNHNNEEKRVGIIFSTISNDGKWIAYSTKYGLRVFQFVYENDKAHLLNVQNEGDQNEIHIRGFFTKNNSQLITATSGGGIRVYDISDNTYFLKQTIDTEGFEDTITNLVCSDDDTYFGASDPSCNIFVWHNNNKQWLFHCKLPKYKCAPTCMSFDHTSSKLIAAYVDDKVIEYDLKNKAFTEFSRKLQNSLDGSLRHFPIGNILHDLRSGNIILQDDNSIMVINQQEVLEFQPKAKRKNKNNSFSHNENKTIKNVKISKHFVHLGWLSDTEIVAVQVNPLALLEQLPPVFLQNKFGTK